MLPFETTETDRQTDEQPGILQNSGANRPRVAHLGAFLSTPQCQESTALPYTHYSSSAKETSLLLITIVKVTVIGN